MATKKASKSAAKQSWKRRWCFFNAELLEFSWHETEGRPPKGTFSMDPTELRAEVTTEHSRDNELSLMSAGNTFYVSLDKPEEAVELLTKIDAAKRLALAADLKTSFVRAKDAAGPIPDAPASDPAPKVFSWGVGSVLGVDNSNVQGWSVPQRLAVVRSPTTPRTISAGPEHAAVITTTSSVYLWGSNEFRQVAAPADVAAASKPLLLSALSMTRKVLSIACGGSHTLAVVSDVDGAKEGTLVGWGTGTVGQLGLGEGTPIAEVPVVIPLPGTALTKGKPALVTRAYAGLVSSAAVNSMGELFVWGDASVGRLGLSFVPDTTPPGAVPALVNAQKVWSPTQLTFSAHDVDAEPGANLCIADVALGGSYSIFLINIGRGRGNVMLISGGLGIDITRDTYGYPIGLSETEIQKAIDAELKGLPRCSTPQPVAPFEKMPVVLAAFAGARHAAVVVADEARGGAPRVYTAGKGWLGHRETKDTRLIQAPAVTTFFAPVAGGLDGVDVVEVACGHSHTIVRTADHRVFSWGRGDSGELGQGNLSDHSMPFLTRQIDGHTWTQVGAGSYYSIGIATPGSLPSKSFSEVLSDFQKRTRAIAEEEARSRSAPHEAARSVATTMVTPTPAAAAAAMPLPSVMAPAPAPMPAAVSAPEPVPVAEEPAPAEIVAVEAPVEAAEQPAEQAQDANALPPGWDYDYDAEGTIYFIDPQGNTQWEDPRV